MPRYEVEAAFSMPEWDSHIVEADNPDQAEEFATEYFKETYPDAIEISVETVKELVR